MLSRKKKKNSNFHWGPLATVNGIMGNTLNHKLSGKIVLLLICGQQDSLQGILQLSHKWKEIVDNLEFHKDKGIQRVITPREMGQVLDYPEEKMHKITEGVLSLLINDEHFPGKIVYITLLSLITISPEEDPQGVSSKRKRQINSKLNPNVPSQKRIKCSYPKTEQANVEGLQLNIEDLMEDIDLKLNQKNMGDEEEEGEPSSKAVRAYNSKVTVHLWNDCVAQKLTKH